VFDLDIDTKIKNICNTNLLVIGIIARLEPVKFVDVSIDLVAQVFASNHMIRLIILGDGSERTRLEKKVEGLGIKQVVYFFGMVPNAAWYAHYFDFVLATTLNPNLGLTVIEAMKQGVVPLIFARSDQEAQMAMDTAFDKEFSFIIRRNDPNFVGDFSAFLKKYAERKDFIRQNVLAYANKTFSFNAHIQNLIDLLGERR